MSFFGPRGHTGSGTAAENAAHWGAGQEGDPLTAVSQREVVTTQTTHMFSETLKCALSRRTTGSQKNLFLDPV
jgi:hypothetical protein